MDASTLTQLVGSLGFPIVCCGYMMITNNKTLKENTEAVNSLKETLKLFLLQKEGDNNE